MESQEPQNALHQVCFDREFLSGHVVPILVSTWRFPLTRFWGVTDQSTQGDLGVRLFESCDQGVFQPLDVLVNMVLFKNS